MSVTMARGSRYCRSLAMISRAPAAIGARYSQPVTSKQKGDSASSTSVSASGTESLVAASSASRFARETSTPFGVPVDPEVNRT